MRSGNETSCIVPVLLRVHNPYSHNMVASDHACLFGRAIRAVAAALASDAVLL